MLGALGVHEVGCGGTGMWVWPGFPPVFSEVPLFMYSTDRFHVVFNCVLGENVVFDMYLEAARHIRVYDGIYVYSYMPKYEGDKLD